MVSKLFDYETAFSRNIGWVTLDEQRMLRSKRIAIAGLGGVGGSHLLTLTRLGLGAFNLADFDTFDQVNFNRQAGANIHQLGRPKVDVLAEMALAINPQLDIRRFPDGVTMDNWQEFLRDVDIYIDGLDFFAFPMRKQVFAACHELGIPAVTAAPLGMSTALLNFLPGHMSFEEYFRWEGCDETEMGLRFLLGLAPSGLHSRYLVDPDAINVKERRGPSTPMGCELCAGVAASQALKILLKRGDVLAAPHGLQFDAYRNKLAHTWRPGGNRNPLQRFHLRLARRRMLNSANPSSTKEHPMTLIEKVLDCARWAPSGDNTQPWR
ncbi:MAG: ThiF family adenylyltransferase, partial [Methylococcaceae bacterium]|nr:ThiF family adenylyltransferase [Methylococcaceae bacterium]